MLRPPACPCLFKYRPCLQNVPSRNPCCFGNNSLAAIAARAFALAALSLVRNSVLAFALAALSLLCNRVRAAVRFALAAALAPDGVLAAVSLVGEGLGAALRDTLDLFCWRQEPSPL